MQICASPAAIVEGVERQAHVFATPCGSGQMIWRVWGEGLPLVLLHGGHGSWTHWLRNVPELSKHFRTIVPDMPGHGDSATQADPQTLQGAALLMARGLSEIIGSTQRFAIAGFSLGAVIAGYLAASMPERVQRLVLVGAGRLGLPRPPIPKLVKWHEIADEPGRREAHQRNLAAIMFADPHAADDLAVFLQRENTRRARRKGRPPAHADELRRALETVSLPLAGIWGEYDAFTGPYIETRRACLAELDPRSMFAVIRGAGHWVQYERALEFNAALRVMLVPTQ